jgi:hypothetical protein
MPGEKIVASVVRGYSSEIQLILQKINTQANGNNEVILALDNTLVALRIILRPAIVNQNIYIEMDENNILVLNRAIGLINQHYGEVRYEEYNLVENIELTQGWFSSIALRIASFACVYMMHIHDVYDPNIAGVNLNGCDHI